MQDVWAGLREINREHMAFLWEMRSSGGVEALDSDDRRILRAMEAHEELHPLWDRLEFVRPDSGEVLIGGVNPVFHIMLDAVVANQVAVPDPPEARTALQALQEAGFSRARAVHIIAGLFTEHMWEVFHHRKPFDRVAYTTRLRLLGGLARQAGQARWRANSFGEDTRRPRVRLPGRNDPCPCGSGLKFKKCCGRFSVPALRPESGLLVLEGGSPYVTAAYLPTAEQGDVPLLLHNMSAVAAALAGDLGDPQGALHAYRRMLQVAEGVKDDARRNGFIEKVLEEIVTFCFEHPAFATEGAEAARRRAMLQGDGLPDDRWAWELDEAELRALAGQAKEAEAIFRRVAAEAPHDFEVNHRWAHWLAQQGREEEARAVWLGLLASGGLTPDEQEIARAHLRELRQREP
ncbi:DUF1841 family protein [Carboxydochorda subterranea]|uniref:DUF1841 family protein n=1 Tax=Carboxydichorda subterranea TaxID=3109565 RepID=A0ABZ1BTW6_9FIRM|nr:DUF1841 family protein [Limnochorda sp. L945t]WRP16023.1 DUF1841 family protein [Limnochorda sp. L945t]